MRLFILLLASTLSACSSVSSDMITKAEQTRLENSNLANPLAAQDQSFHYHAEQLARQLLDTAGVINVSKSIIVGSFLPSVNLQQENDTYLQPYSIQLQESMATLFVQAGFNIVEYKTASQIKLTPSADITLSRNVNELLTDYKADYLLTGTYTKQQAGLIVNVKLINYQNQVIAAAATKAIPLNLFSSHKMVNYQHGGLYREGY